jgi:predicted DNA-binding transcriptional regulator AlpA
MENPFEIILEKLNNIEKAIEKQNASAISDSDIVLSANETCQLLKIKRTTFWKHTKSGKLTSYSIGKRVYYKKEEILKSLTRIN